MKTFAFDYQANQICHGKAPFGMGWVSCASLRCKKCKNLKFRWASIARHGFATDAGANCRTLKGWELGVCQKSLFHIFVFRVLVFDILTYTVYSVHCTLYSVQCTIHISTFQLSKEWGEVESKNWSKIPTSERPELLQNICEGEILQGSRSET